MKKTLTLLVALMLVFTVGSMIAAYAGPGPAPNSHDGVSDGSGWEDGTPGPFGPSDPVGITSSGLTA